MAHLKMFTIPSAALLAAVSVPVPAQEPAGPEVVGRELPANGSSGELERACGVVHEEGRSACTHDRMRSRSTILAWWGADGDDPKPTPEEERELDKLLDGGRPVHDQLNSMFLRIVPPTPGDLRGCPDSPPAPEVARPKYRHTLRRTNREFDFPCPKF